jgi:glucose-1-phosphate thymidylyltransferase
MRPLTYAVNKHFIPVANRLLIEYPIKTLVEAGVKEIGITYNPGQLEYAKEVLGDGSKWKAKFTYILQEKPAGLANIVEVAEKFLKGEKFVFHLGDNIFTEGIKDLVEYFDTSSSIGMVTMIHHEQNRRMGVPFFDGKGRLVKYVEKPENPPHDFAVPGVYFLDGNVVFDAFKGKDRLSESLRGEYEIPDLFQWLIDRKNVVEVKEYKGVWLDPGKFDDWLEANQFLLDREVVRIIKGEIQEASHVEGRVEILEGTRIENSVIRGPVRIGKSVVIKDSFVGPFTSIYDGCEITNCRIENSVVMGDVKLNSIKGVITDSILGEATEVNGEDKGGVTKLFLGQNSRVEI